jgi:omega-hydroxy-beta-dihydromenaquinone-9 sulfotransferase
MTRTYGDVVLSYTEFNPTTEHRTEVCRVKPLAIAQASQLMSSKNGSGGAKFDPQGFFCIWHGSSFGGWLRLLATRPPIHWSRLHKVATVTALSAVNSVTNLCESIVYGKKIAQQTIDHDPVFILGHWRSGTTLLHNLMTMDPQFTFPNLYEVMFPGNFLLTERLITSLTSWAIPKTRPMDNVEAGYHMPQEDEVALVLLSGISPYLMLAHPTDPSKYERYLELTDISEKELARWKERFLYFLKKLTIKANKPIVFKSPTHTFRIPLLLEMFPNAKFVYIYRDPYAVYSSSLHLRKTLFTENGLSRIVMDEKMEEDALNMYTHCFETYERTRGLIPAGNLCEIRFEDLESDPLGEMHRVYDSLSLGGWENLEPAITKKLPDLTCYRKNSFKMDENLMRRVYSRWRPAFDRYGYPSRLPEHETAAARVG